MGEYLRMVATHKVKPLTVPLDDPYNTLLKLQQYLGTNPHLELQDDPDRNTWVYFSIMNVIPTIMDDSLLYNFAHTPY